MNALAEVYPKSNHKLCLWHTMENIRKHGKGLGPGVLAGLLGKVRSAAYAQNEEASKR